MSLPKEVKSVLAQWLPSVLEELDSKIRSVFIGGGVALGDFAPASSDIDTYVVLSTPLLKEDSLLIDRIHDELKERFIHQRIGGWQSDELMQVEYFPIGLAEDAEGEWLYYSVRIKHSMWVNKNISPFSRYIVAEYGIHYYGEPVSFARPTREKLLHQLNRQVESWLSPPSERLNQDYWMTLQICLIARSIVFLRHGLVLSKTAALKHEIDANSPFVEAYQMALFYRENGPVWGRNHLVEIRNSFNTVRVIAANLVRQLIDAEQRKHRMT